MTTATTSYKLAALNEDWASLSGVQVEAINLTTLKPDDVQRTALNGVVTFTGLPAGPHIFRVRARRVSTKVGGRTYTGLIRLIPIAMGNQGISKHYVVDANGMGTHTTVQAAITAAITLGSGFEVVIYINPGAYTEDLTAPFASTGGSIYLVGEGAVVNLNAGAYNSIVTITGSSGSSPVLEASGVGNIAAVGIEFAQKGGGSAEVIKLAVNNDLEMYECKLVACAGQRAFTAVIDVRCRNCVITAASGRIIDPANAVYFEHCYLNGAGLIKGNFDLLVVKDCILVGTAPAGEYWIHEAATVVSRRLRVIGCESSAGGGSGFISFGDPSAVSTGCIITNNRINVGANQIGIRLIELVAAVVTDNIIRGTSDSDGSTAISLAGAVGGACRACVVAHNSIYQIQTGINRGTDATDGTCVIGPNAFYDVGTNTTGVPAAEDYGVTVADLNHALLDGTIHTDTVAQAVTAGSMVIGDDTPEWNELVISVPAANVRNVLGIDNGETLPSWKTALDGTSPAAVAATASPGTSLVFAHRDLVHSLVIGTTRGDFLVWNSTPVASRLALGAAGTVLIGGANDPSYSGSPALSGTLTVDTIGEYTGAAGVTIDSVLLKDGEVSLADSKALILGTGDDAKIYYDGTNLIIDPDVVGSGDFRILGSQHIIHAAIEDDDHALEIDVAAGNYSDIKAIDIVYAAGELQAGEDDEAILVNIDEDAADGGRITGLDVLTTTSGDALVEALFAGVGVVPIEQLSGTFGNPDSALVKAADELADLINPAANTTVFVADDDTMTIGKSAKFEEIEFILSTVAGGGGIAPTFEYSTGVGAWAAFSPMDGTNGLRNTGVVAWEDSDIPGWNTGLAGEYLIRITRTRGTVPTTPVVSFLQCASATEFGWDKSGDVIINSLATDTINERTAAAGVTVESVLLKDGQITLGGDVVLSRAAAGQVLITGTGDSILWVGDSNYGLNFAGGDPIFAYDSNDYWRFTRSTNTLNFVIGGATQFSFVSETASFPRGTVHIGTDDTLKAVLALYGHAGGTVDGAEIQLYLSADHDGTFHYWGIDILSDDLRFFSSDGATVNVMTAEGQWQLPVTGSGAGILVGGDAQIYRGAANRLDLAASDALVIHGGAGDFAAPVNGMLWYNTTTGKLRVYESGAWANVV